jgi:hypothetical protein
MALSPSFDYLGNKEEVERNIADREREEEEYNRMHPTPREIKEKFERAHTEANAMAPPPGLADRSGVLAGTPNPHQEFIRSLFGARKRSDTPAS